MEFKRSLFVKGIKTLHLLILIAVLSHTGCNEDNNADLIPFTFVSEDIYLEGSAIPGNLATGWICVPGSSGFSWHDLI